MTVTAKKVSKQAAVGSPAKAVGVLLTLRQQSKLRVSKKAVVAVQSALTHLLGEVLEGAKSAAAGRTRVMPKHISAAFSTDSDLRSLGLNWMFREGRANSTVRFPAAAGGVADRDGGRPLAGADRATSPKATAPKPEGAKVKRSTDVTSHKFSRTVKLCARDRECRLGTGAHDALQTIAAEFTADLAQAAGEAARKNSRDAVRAEDVRTAVEEHVKGDLKAHMIKEIDAALAKADQAAP
ncbi:hypothetical protein AB0J03_37060 [Streptomyces microflavus]|uniref:hypothetical protein n=1 Tax=Streptomyces microflavus TaxID=1919 RepID=UPI0033D62E57